MIFVRVASARGRDNIERPALSCLFTSTAHCLSGLTETPELRGRGFLARWFYSMPTSRVGYRDVAPNAVPASIRSKYESQICRMWHIDYLDEDKAARASF